METNLSFSVSESIKLKILSGDYKTNEKLPNEMVLAESLGVSRTTIREAIKILVSKNYVTIKRGVGTFVNETPGVSDDPMGLDLVPHDILERNLYDYRLHVEPIVARLAADNASDHQMKHLEDIVRKMKSIAEISCVLDTQKYCVDKFFYQELLFHSMLYDMTGNTIFSRQQPLVIKSITLFYASINAEEYELDVAYKPHENIFAAIKNRNAEEAFAMMTEHMQNPFFIRR